MIWLWPEVSTSGFPLSSEASGDFSMKPEVPEVEAEEWGPMAVAEEVVDGAVELKVAGVGLAGAAAVAVAVEHYDNTNRKDIQASGSDDTTV